MNDDALPILSNGGFKDEHSWFTREPLKHTKTTKTAFERLGIREKYISLHLDEPRPRAPQRLAKAVRRQAICLGEVREKSIPKTPKTHMAHGLKV